MYKILLVDDSEVVRTVLKKALVKEGLDVIEAKDALDALQYISHNKIDLMILDVNMPGDDGVKFCETIKKNPEFSYINIFFLTSEYSPLMKAKAKALGAKVWITKPFVPETIASIVRKFLDKESKK